MPELNPRQQSFVQEYLKDPNATQAAIRAGYSARTANPQAARLLAKVSVRQAVAEGLERIAKQAEVDATWLLRRLVELADAPLEELFAEDGSLREVKDMPLGLRRLIGGIEISELWEGKGKQARQVGWTKKVKLRDTVRVLELIGKHVDVGALRERIQTEHLVEVTIRDYTGLEHEIEQVPLLKEPTAH
ncbi:MAG: terminase small subunit [Nitrospirales bacterium]